MQNVFYNRLNSYLQGQEIVRDHTVLSGAESLATVFVKQAIVSHALPNEAVGPF